MKQTILFSGLAVTVFCPLACFTDLLALRGVLRWRRRLLLPGSCSTCSCFWPAFTAFSYCMFVVGFNFDSLCFLLFAVCVFSTWGQMKRLHEEMDGERPRLEAGVTVVAPELDLPPKYEELLEQQPPPPGTTRPRGWPSTTADDIIRTFDRVDGERGVRKELYIFRATWSTSYTCADCVCLKLRIKNMKYTMSGGREERT